MKHFRMLAAGLCSAVLLCGFAIPAYAYSDSGNEEPPVAEETPAPEPAPTITPGEGFSEDGNLVTRDLLYDAATNKQFITVETSGGNTFYIQALLEANGLAAGKDHQFKGRYEAEKNAVIISLENDEREC